MRPQRGLVGSFFLDTMRTIFEEHRAPDSGYFSNLLIFTFNKAEPKKTTKDSTFSSNKTKKPLIIKGFFVLGAGIEPARPLLVTGF